MSLAAIPLTYPQPSPASKPPAHLRVVDSATEPPLSSLHQEAALFAAGLPPLTHKLIGKLAVFAYETVEGTRAIGQLSSWVSTSAARQLAEYRSLTVERRSLFRDTRRIVPTVRRVRVVQPMPGIAEAAVVLNTGTRAKAVALRFEGFRGRWQATSITVL